MKVKLNNADIELTEQQRQDLLKQLNQSNVKELVEKEVLEMLEKYKSNVIFLTGDEDTSKYPTSRFKILNDKYGLLFDINYNERNKHFYYLYDGVYMLFYNKYNIGLDDFNEVMQSILDEYLNLKGVRPTFCLF